MSNPDISFEQVIQEPQPVGSYLITPGTQPQGNGVIEVKISTPPTYERTAMDHAVDASMILFPVFCMAAAFKAVKPILHR